MRLFKAVPEKTGDVYHFNAKDYTDARHWVTNHLNLSLNYSVVDITKRRTQEVAT